MSRWAVVFDRGTAFVAGPKTEARRRIAACGDHSPIWIGHRSAWATSPEAANRVLDQLEARNVTVSVDDVRQPRLDLTETGPASVAPERQGELW